LNLKSFAFRITHWETWHYLAKYIPISPAWLWYCIRARSLWFFTPSNPTLTFGGFEGESKKEMFEQLPKNSYPNTVFINPSISFDEVEKSISANQIVYPLAVKPDIGMMGLMFRKIGSPDELRKYHEAMPVEYMIQDFVPYPIEVSVFYYRFPNEKKGTITGFLRKDYLKVIGDGKSTLWELVQNYPRVRFRLEEMKAKHKERLEDIIPENEIYYLSYALNLSRGGKLVSLAHEKDDNLLKVFDDLSNYAGKFYYGRYDIKCKSIEDLKQGKNFVILEFNGCGAEPHHIYGNGYNIFQAYSIVLHHWNVLYKISRHNHRNGFPQWKLVKGWKFLGDAKKHFRMLKKLDASTELS
jgi:hypothetical protein